MSELSKETPKAEEDARNSASEVESDDQANEQGSKGKNPETSRRGAKRRIIDETLLDEDEARRLEARRAYNRQCAAKARKRSKDLISHLQQQVEDLSKDKAALERTNEVMQAQLQLLEQQNRTLMMSQRAAPAMIPGVSGAGSLLGGFQAGAAPLVAGAGGLPSVSLLESLSAQGRLSTLQGEGQQQVPPGFPSRAPAPPASGGTGGVDANKYYHG